MNRVTINGGPSKVRRDESGFTLIEEVVALGLIAVLLLPLAAVYYSAASANAGNREYGDAVAIGDAALAQADAISYQNLGFYEEQFAPSPVPGFGSQPGVDLGAQPSNGSTAEVQPVSAPEQVGSIKYVLHTYVVWVNGSGANHSYAYKQVYAVVTWQENGRTQQATENVLVYPGSLGAYAGPQNNAPPGSIGTPDNVDLLPATVPTAPAGQTQVSLTWDQPFDATGYYEAVWAPDPGGQMHLASPDSSGSGPGWAPQGSTTSPTILGTSTSFTVNGLTPGASYWFEIVAFSSDGSEWAVSQNWVSAQTLTPPPPPCTLGTLDVTQMGQGGNSVQVTKSNKYLVGALTISIGYSGSCTASADTVKVTATDSGGTADPLSPYILSFSSSPAQYSYTLCPHNTGFSTGTHTYTALLNGTVTSSTTQVSFTTKNTSAGC